MNTSDLLEQLLRAGQGSRAQQGSGSMSSQDGLGGLLGGVAKGGQGGDLGTLLKGAGGGALAAGALGLLLGNKSARKMGGKALTYGGLAALGVVKCLWMLASNIWKITWVYLVMVSKATRMPMYSPRPSRSKPATKPHWPNLVYPRSRPSTPCSV